MAEGRSLTSISIADYEAIEAAVMETERGRWFLREYAKRNRNADTEVLLEAITRLEQRILGEGLAKDHDRLSAALGEMARAITLTREEARELRKLQTPFVGAPDPEPLFDVVRVSKEAASAGRRAAAEIREAATAFRPNAHDEGLLHDIERRSTEVAAAFDLAEAGTRTVERIVSTLRYLETRIQEMLSPGKAPASAGMSPESAGEAANAASTPTAAVNEEVPPKRLEAEDRRDSRPVPDGIETSSTADESGDIETRELAALGRREHPDLAEKLDDIEGTPEIAAIEKAATGAQEAMIPVLTPEPEVQRASPPIQHHSAALTRAADLQSRPATSDDALAARRMATSIASPAAEPAPRLRPTISFRREAFAEIDRLTTREKLRLFS
jgi:hypothetical protein